MATDREAQREGPPQKWSERLKCGTNVGRVGKDKPELHKANRSLMRAPATVGGGTQENNLAAKAKTRAARKNRTWSPPKGVQTVTPVNAMRFSLTP